MNRAVEINRDERLLHSGVREAAGGGERMDDCYGDGVWDKIKPN